MVYNPVLNQVRRWLRQVLFVNVYRQPPPPPVFLDPNVARLADTFGNLALSSSPSVLSANRHGAGGGVAVLERQLDRAFTQVLGPQPGRGPESFLKAVSEKFPVRIDGQRGTVATWQSLALSAPGAGAAVGGGPQTAAQLSLQRQGRLVAEDAQRILKSLAPLTALTSDIQVANLHALADRHLEVLVGEFGRAGEPRNERVVVALNALDGTRGALPELQRVILLLPQAMQGLPPGSVTSVTEEQSAESIDLLADYVATLRFIWGQYQRQLPVVGGLVDLLPTEQRARAQAALVTIGGATRNALAILDSIGFTEAERRSFGARLDAVVQPAVLGPILALPQYTLGDLLDWSMQLAEEEGLQLLAEGERDGFDTVTDHAHRIFMIFADLLLQSRIFTPVDRVSGQILPLALADERVGRALDDLVFQVLILADLAQEV